jgi:hypothetical protein
MAAPSTKNISTTHFEPSYSREHEFQVGRDLVEYLRDYARERPEVAALWCFGIGFILGWKLKPW